VIVAHIMGIPVEETLPTVLAGGAAAVTAFVVVAQVRIRRLGRGGIPLVRQRKDKP
jgi:hypothetical protein